MFNSSSLNKMVLSSTLDMLSSSSGIVASSSSSLGSLGSSAEFKGRNYFSPDGSSLGKNQREDIILIEMYEVPLYDWQKRAGWTDVTLNHQFVVLETKSYWWSLEFVDTEILTQWSTSKEKVADKYRGEARKTPRGLIKEGRAKYPVTVEDLNDKLDEQGFLTKKYNWVECNCKDFARAAFAWVVERKEYDWQPNLI